MLWIMNLGFDPDTLGSLIYVWKTEDHSPNTEYTCLDFIAESSSQQNGFHIN